MTLPGLDYTAKARATIPKWSKYHNGLLHCGVFPGTPRGHRYSHTNACRRILRDEGWRVEAGGSGNPI